MPKNMKAALIVMLLTLPALLWGCQSDAEPPYATEDSANRILSGQQALAQSARTTGERMNQTLSGVENVDARIDDLSARLGGIERQQDAIVSTLARIEARMGETVGLPSQTGKIIPQWDPGVSVEEARDMFASCMSERFGIIGQLMGSEMFSEDMLSGFGEGVPDGLSELESVRLGGLLFGCWY